MPKVALLILSDPMIYPPTVNAANILADKGYAVDLYGIKYNTTDKIELHANINLIYVGNQQKGIRNVWQYLYVYVWLIYHCFNKKYNFLISYDSLSVGPAFVISKLFKLKWIFHSHDLMGNVNGWYRLLKWLEKKLVKYAHIISFPQINRAESYQKELYIDKDIDIVFNGPRKSWGENSSINDKLKPIKQQFDNIIIYQGGISKYFNFESILSAIPFCKSKFALCFIGKELEYRVKEYYVQMVKSKELDDRVFFLNPVGYNEIPSITKYCTLGLAKMAIDENVPVNDYYLIGASNKITEYISQGLPIIFPETPVNKAFLKEREIGIICNPSNPEKFASVIDELLTNQEKYHQLSSNCKKHFNEELNFDTQFEKLYQHILQITQS